MKITKRVGIRRFHRRFHSIVKGGFPIIVTKRKQPVYMLIKVGKKQEEVMECEMCKRERKCTLRGIDLYGNVSVKWMCRRCEGRLRGKGVIVI